MGGEGSAHSHRGVFFKPARIPACSPAPRAVAIPPLWSLVAEAIPISQALGGLAFLMLLTDGGFDSLECLT